MSGDGNRNKGDLNNAGNVLGSMFNTNQYDPGYREKKGMKFFWIALAVVFVTTAIILMIKPYPNLDIVRADENGVTYYSVDINVFGKYEILSERFFPYSQEDLFYLGLEGRDAFIAMTANSKEADMLVSTADILGGISDRITLKNSAAYLNTNMVDTERLLENSKNGFYGMPVSTGFKVIRMNAGEYIALTPNIVMFTDAQLNKIIRDMTSVYD